MANGKSPGKGTDSSAHLGFEATARRGSANPKSEAIPRSLESTDLKDTENVPLKEKIQTYFAREVAPHVPDAWIDLTTCDAKDGQVEKVGYEIPFNRHFYVFQTPRLLSAIDADLKASTDRILNLIGGLMAERISSGRVALKAQEAGAKKRVKKKARP